MSVDDDDTTAGDGDAADSGGDGGADEHALGDGVLQDFLPEEFRAQLRAEPQPVLQARRIEDLVGAALKHDGGAFGPAGQQVLEFTAAEHAGCGGQGLADQQRRRRDAG